MAASARSPWLDLDRPAGRHAVALALALAALLLRAWQLGAQPIWLDEALTAHIAHALDGFDYVHNTPPLYHALTRLWAAWFGVDAASLRALSALAGAGFVWASFHAARAGFSNRAAVAAALLALLSPIHLYYSQEARAYSLLLTELMLMVWALWRLAAAPRWSTWGMLVAVGAAALHTHYLAAIPLVLAHAVVAASALAAGRRRAAHAVATALAAAALLLLPWLLVWSARTPFAAEDMRWLALLWSQIAGVEAVFSSLELFLLGGQADHAPIFLKQFTSMPFAEPARITALAAMALLLGESLVRWPRFPAAKRTALLHAIVLCLGPLAALWLISLQRPVYAPGRYDLIAFPGFVLWLGGAMSAGSRDAAVGWRWAARIACVVIAVDLLAKDWRYFTSAPAPDPHRAVADHLAAHVGAGEAVVLCGAVGLPVLAHLYEDGYVWHERTCRQPRTGAAFPCRLLPSALEEAPAAVSRYLRALDDGSLAPDLARMLPQIEARGIWLVLGDEFRDRDEDPATAAAGRRLFQVLHEGGYVLAGGVPAIGVAHLVHRGGR
ncbi:MAG: glycosyltransferase family 39 protein [Planctomycetes bacterium]|nr:glycosyltransferase family 39 protein [Planctomycetota bacterium]